ncbi:MAG: two-CW domain-containing protein [bacterium]
MTKKLNCWQYRNCGREPGGLLADSLGQCPVATTLKFDGMNDGVAAGRACWMVADSCCRRKQRAGRGDGCHACEFYRRVLYEQEESALFRFASPV